MLAQSMKEVLANTFTLYFMAHAAHWNVEGMLFASLHTFFGTLYDELHDAVDPIAEHLRALGEYAPVSVTKLVEVTTIPEDSAVYEPREMLTRLVAANDLVRASLHTARTEAETAGEYGVVNFLEDRLDTHDKYAWMLKSHLR